jgi:RNA polymerase sigma-70 factor (ECF subfamily)
MSTDDVKIVESIGSLVHAVSPTIDATDWAEMVRLYDRLLDFLPTPVVELNRAVALAMRDSPAAGLAQIDALRERGLLVGYHLAHAARADLCRRLGRAADARVSYHRSPTGPMPKPGSTSRVC